MAILEIMPGVTMLEAFRRAGGGFDSDDNLQIGRTPPLSSNKAQTHFPILQQFTGIPYEQWLFFDDCNWTDHCTAVSRAHGVVAQRTPHGLTAGEWEAGLRAWQDSRL